MKHHFARPMTVLARHLGRFDPSLKPQTQPIPAARASRLRDRRLLLSCTQTDCCACPRAGAPGGAHSSPRTRRLCLLGRRPGLLRHYLGAQLGVGGQHTMAYRVGLHALVGQCRAGESEAAGEVISDHPVRLSLPVGLRVSTASRAWNLFDSRTFRYSAADLQPTLSSLCVPSSSKCISWSISSESRAGSGR